MKKILFALALLIMVGFDASTASAQIRWPFGAADATVLNASQTSDTLNVSNTMTIVTLSDTLHSAYTIAVQASSELKAGALVFIITRCGAITRTTTFSTSLLTGFTITTTLSGTANKSKLTPFVYDGTHFLNYATSVQLN